jgi:uncharacterized protein
VTDTDTDTHPTSAESWQQIIRGAALDATLGEARRRYGTEHLPFNYRWEHVRAVVRLALRLAELTGADAEVVEAAAWLHDIRKRGRDDNHGVDGAADAREILAATDFPPAKIDAVADAISKHVGLVRDEPVEPLEAAVLWDADKLAKLGATAVVHFIGYRLSHREIDTEELLERLSDQPWQPAAVRSFHTAPARAAGEARLALFQSFWDHARREFHAADLRSAPRPDSPPDLPPA